MSRETLKVENLSQDETVQRETRENVSQVDDPQDVEVYMLGCDLNRIEKVYFKNRLFESRAYFRFLSSFL